MKASARASAAAFTRSGRNRLTSSVRVRTAFAPASRSMAAMRFEISRVTVFSCSPVEPMAPGSVPPCPGSTAIVLLYSGDLTTSTAVSLQEPSGDGPGGTSEWPT